MRLIIDIPKSIYDKICLKMMHTEIENPNLYFESLISNGTPIPYNATVCDIEQIRAEIEQKMSTKPSEFNQHDESDYDRGLFMALLIIDKYTKGGMSPEVKEHYEQLAEHYNKKGKKR